MNVPVLVGVAQFTQFWDDQRQPAEPLLLMEKVAKEVATDVGFPDIIRQIDAVYVVNIVSYKYEDAPAQLAERLGINPKFTYYSSIGGNTPQNLVNKACLALEKGEHKAVLISGAEVMYGFKKALQKGMKPEWTPSKMEKKIQGDNRPPTNDLESAYELFMPVVIYPILETAYRAHTGRKPAEHQRAIGELYSQFAKRASENPFAWTQQAYSAAEIYQPAEENRMVSYPYTKRMNANITVDQAAALILTTEDEARKMGISEEKWVYPMGGADLNEVWEVTRRPKLYESQAINEAARLALRQAGLQIENIDAFDLYSCFPVAVQMAQKALGIEEKDARPITLTGGLSYFGGPGSNYNMHGIVEAVKLIREKPDFCVMCTALGWSMTKHAIGVYGKKVGVLPWSSVEMKESQLKIDQTALAEPVTQAQGTMRVEGYTMKYDNNQQPVKATLIGKMDNGVRTVAYFEASPDQLRRWETEELVGKEGKVYYDEQKKRNYFSLY